MLQSTPSEEGSSLAEKREKEMLSMAKPEPLLDTMEAAEFLGLKPQTLRKWRWDGSSPPYIRLGRGKKARPKYRREDLEKWMKDRTFTSTSAESEAERKEGR